jgi:histone-lysine N-methyltransferase SETMAR
MEKGTTINAASYCATLERLKTAIKRKRPGLLTKGVSILHDNARPHVATATQELLQRFRWTVLEHPAYSPDLAPSDFHLFPALKDHLAAHKFSSDDVKTAVTRWLKLQGTEFYEAGIDKLVP